MTPKIPANEPCAWTGPDRQFRCPELATKILQVGRYDYAFLCATHYEFLTTHGVADKKLVRE